jgi:hypothetical protein
MRPEPILRRFLIFVGWVEQSETQQTPQNVGFRSSTQPTHFLFFCLNRVVLRPELQFRVVYV